VVFFWVRLNVSMKSSKCKCVEIRGGENRPRHHDREVILAQALITEAADGERPGIGSGVQVGDHAGLAPFVAAAQGYRCHGRFEANRTTVIAAGGNISCLHSVDDLLDFFKELLRTTHTKNLSLKV
jgi:hypothetical protein